MAVLEIGLKLASLRPRTEGILYIFDSRFFERLDSVRKAHVFRKVTSLDDGLSQTLFCVNHETDAESLKDVLPENWSNAEQLDRLTLHTFL